MELKEIIAMHTSNCDYCKTKNPNNCSYIKLNHADVKIRYQLGKRYQRRSYDSFKLKDGSTLKVQNGWK